MQIIDPRTYPNWNERLLDLPQVSIFHTVNWLRVLHGTYGYRPVYFACFEAGKPAVLLPMLEVKSWITGARGVSLPFSDHCEPIMAAHMSVAELIKEVIASGIRRRWTYVEFRGGDTLFEEALPFSTYYRHSLALHHGEETIFAALRRNYRAKIRKAGENALTIHTGQAPEAMAEYYRLHCLTRQRQGLPPQPRRFFERIHEHMIAAGLGFVTLVSHRGRNIAGAVFFGFGRRATYKFGASDLRFQHLQPNYLLFWHVIQWLCQRGYTELCFGRTEPGHTGLMQFKDGWGTRRHPLHYYRYDCKTGAFVQDDRHATVPGSRVWRHMPLPLLKLTGSVLYPHLG